MYYTVYKVTNKINGKIYIGCHRTKDLNDAYMGSGKILKKAQDKYGMENFNKEILYVFDNLDEMFEMEATLVNSEFVKELSNYNLKVGGEGGWGYDSNDPKQVERRRQNGRNIPIEVRRENGRKNGSKLFKRLHKEGKIKYDTFTGKTHTEETKQKMSKAKLGKSLGKENSQYGTCWIYNLEIKESRRISKEELHLWIEQGWIKGRKIKFN